MVARRLVSNDARTSNGALRKPQQYRNYGKLYLMVG